MQELAAELLAEGVPLVLRAVAAVVLTLGGAAAELNAVASFGSGNLLVGLWMLYVGAVALYGGLFVFGPEVLDAVDRSEEPA